MEVREGGGHGGTDEKKRTYEGARRKVASTTESKGMSSRWRSLLSKSYYPRLSSRTQPSVRTHSGTGRRCSSSW